MGSSLTETPTSYSIRTRRRIRNSCYMTSISGSANLALRMSTAQRHTRPWSWTHFWTMFPCNTARSRVTSPSCSDHTSSPSRL
ncbi:hypothetical protein MAR_012759 [Mya arenaria]|uniref:Uncharacterized protein n=1 Tax=Mya arenaria TaxID=6604 RepID=A0ABY7FXW8_MYAAR|nr:hypothetical protein MAR_012759 [Mya arenaria]